MGILELRPERWEGVGYEPIILVWEEYLHKSYLKMDMNLMCLSVE